MASNPEEADVNHMHDQGDIGIQVRIDAGDKVLDGELVAPRAARGVVVFAHGSGSSRFSPRNRAVAQVLQRGGLATLLFDLLTEVEAEADERTAALRFDIALLSRRLAGAVRWLAAEPRWGALRIGLFGASTGAAAALVAAAELPRQVRAVVSRGGRPDLATDALARVRAPTLLLVGERDDMVLDLNRVAADRMTCHREVVVVPRATHLFEEPGTLQQVAEQARDWFLKYLAPEAPTRGG